MQKQLISLLVAAAAGGSMTTAASNTAACTAPGPQQRLQLGGCMAGDSLVLREINFATGTSTLAPQSRTFLQELARELNANNTLKVGIKGHTDSRGDAAYNMALSESRASAVRDFLLTEGVNPKQLEAEGLGETAPLADNTTPAGQALNRRVELMIIGTLAPVAPAEPPPEHNIYISTFSAQPDKLTVPLGTTVNWHNYDEISHDVTFSDTGSSRIWTRPWQGAATSRTFEVPGVYDYQCSVHKDVNGSITVVAPASYVSETPSPAYAGQTTVSYSPQTQTRAFAGQAQAHGGHSTPAAESAHHSPNAGSTGPFKSTVAAAETGTLVGIKSHAFHPERLVVSPGTTVTWTNHEKSKHQVVFGSEQSEVLRTGNVFEKTFSVPGEYPYHCGFHGYMEGTIIVNGAS